MTEVVPWLSRLPTLELFLVLMGIGLSVSVVLTVLAERAFDAGSRTRTSTSITTVVGVIAGLYAVLIAFVIVNEWQAFNDAQEQVSNESAALSATYFNANVLPEPGRGEILASIRKYDRSVVCDEIPYLATHQGPSTKTRVALQNLFTTVARTAPSAETSAFYTATVNQLGDIAQARRSRINAASSPLPDLLLVVIVVTSLALIAAVSALDTQHRRWHIVITLALTLIVSLNLALILTLDRPFDGSAQVSDAPLREGLPAKGLRCP
jgi:Protein of unknown function (DUF4239)